MVPRLRYLEAGSPARAVVAENSTAVPHGRSGTLQPLGGAQATTIRFRQHAASACLNAFTTARCSSAVMRSWDQQLAKLDRGRHGSSRELEAA